MHFDASLADAQIILNTMYAVAATAAVTDADRASIVAAARYLFRLDMSPELPGVESVRAGELREVASRPEFAAEVVRFATVMAVTDGEPNHTKLKAVLRIAAALGIREDFVDDVKALAQEHLHDAICHIVRAKLPTISAEAWATDEILPRFMPYRGGRGDPGLAARFRALAELPPDTFGHAFAAFYRENNYGFPGEETALGFGFAAPHDSSHVLAGFDVSLCGELLVSSFIAAMHPSHAMAGHVLPVIFSWYLAVALNDTASAAKSILDPEAFWRAWVRGQSMKVDLFGPSWNFWAATVEPIELVRAQVGLAPEPESATANA